ncbi:MAG: autotransporter-associated beta strand repeat-containing protein, partial [Dehalococcoidales bacterium]|nr:autotransporter-associated beta strand repeat-containing protein [Dehalococcoidales bacterium]
GGSLFDTSPVIVDGGILDLAGISDTVAAVTLRSGTITDSVGGATLTGTSFTVWDGTVNAILGGAAALIKNTAGTVRLNKANSYTGLTTVNAGTLVWGITDALSSGGITVNGGVVDIGAYDDTVGALKLTAGTITGSSGVLTSNANYAVSSGTISAILGGDAIGVIKTGAGTVTLTRSNLFSGVSSVAAGGALNIRDSGALGTGTVTITVTSGGALQMQGGITISSIKTLRLGGTGISNTGALRSISGNNEWQGPIILTAATRIRSGRDNLTISGDITGATFGLTIGGPGDTAITGVIATTRGTLTKDGAGTLLLSGNNTYTGLTTISVGVIKLGAAGDGVNGPLGTVAAGTTVAIRAALDLNGYSLSTAEALTLNGSGTLAAGALRNTSASEATYSGLITLGSSSTISGTIILTATLTINNGIVLTNNGIVTVTNFGSGTGMWVQG